MKLISRFHLQHMGEFRTQDLWTEVLPVDVSPASDLLEILAAEPVSPKVSDLADSIV